MKIAFVIQRCGPDVFGGAEALTLQIGMNLSEILDIEILTTRAKDANTWRDYYPEGIQRIGKLKIRRFSVDKVRDPQFVPLSQYLEKNNNDMEKGIEFLNASGPVSNQLMNYIKKNKDEYDLFVFVGYLYWQTYFGLPLVKEKSILLPTAHDEPWIHFKIFNKVFQIPLGYIFLTNSEKKFVHKKFDHTDKPSEVVGHGMDIAMGKRTYQSGNIKLPKNFLLYVGRISTGKGCQMLSDFYNRYRETHSTDLQLIMIGDKEQDLKNTNATILQNLSDQEKFFILQHCKIFVMPSYFESLNIACLEAWLFRKPVLVNSLSAVLQEHCLRSQGGLYFQNYEEFEECIDLISNNEDFGRNLGLNGERYVQENYNWELTRKKYYDFFDKLLTTTH